MTEKKLSPDPSLEELVRELNVAGPSVPGSVSVAPSGEPRVEPLRLRQVEDGSGLELQLSRMITRGATDLIIVPGVAPALRIDGELVPVGSDIGTEAAWALVSPYMSPSLLARLDRDGAVDFSIRLQALDSVAARFRINVHRQKGGTALAIRALPGRVPNLAQLNLPPTLTQLVEPVRGLVLICGPTGSGKSTTVASLLDWLVRRRSIHVLTIEDPIEFELEHHRSVIEQIEVGSDSPSFPQALRAALRQDPDVLFVGEMRDLETVATALTAAETGHLVVATLHTNDVVQAVHRIVDVFQPQQQGQIRQQLALSLHAIVQQILIPRCDGPGRVPAVEVLMANYPVRHHIRSGKLERMYNEITLGKGAGMVSLEESLARLIAAGVIDREEARIRTQRPDELNTHLASSWA